jgi:hypothetical protein
VPTACPAGGCVFPLYLPLVEADSS